MKRLLLVASFAAAAFVAALAPSDVRIAVARSAPSPSPSPTIEPTDTPSPTPTPAPTLRPHHLTVTPVPLRPKRPRATPHATPRPTPSPSPTPSETLSPSPSPTPSGKHPAKPTERPTSPPTPTPTPTPKPTSTPTATASATAPATSLSTPTAKPTSTPRVSPARKATPSPSPSATAVPTPEATATPSITPIPKQIVPIQPTIPQSLQDPGVQSLLHRNIRELTQLAWMTGTWRAHDRLTLGGGKVRDLGITTYVFGFTMHGRWLFGADGKASDFFYITFDPFAHHWVLTRFEDNPSYGILISESGWKGNRIVFESSFSYADGRPYNRRLTLIHKDVRTFGIYDEEQLSDGSWTPDDAIELTKQ